MLGDYESHNPPIYTVSIPVYEGPLDLLLQLIERAELDITTLALAQVTDQYLTHIHNIQYRATEEISVFLIIATKLLQIKSAALLPQPIHLLDSEEDVGNTLIQQLLEYRRYKKAAEFFSLKEDEGKKSYLRLTSPKKVEQSVDMSGLTLMDLVNAAYSVLIHPDNDQLLQNVINHTKYSIRQKIGFIAEALRVRKKVGFWSLVKERGSRVDIVMTFLAILELVKQHLINAYQQSIFGEIEIDLDESWDLNSKEEIDLEFGE